jgi:type III secretion protein Q
MMLRESGIPSAALVDTAANTRAEQGLSLAAYPRLPRLPAPVARAMNAVYAAGAPLAFECGEEHYNLEWVFDPSVFPVHTTLALRVGAAAAWLALENADFCAALASDTAQLLPQGLRIALLTEAMSPALEQAEKLIGTRISISDIGAGAAFAQSDIRFHFKLRNVDTGIASRGFLQTNEASVAESLARALADRKTPNMRWTDFGPRVRLQIGETRLCAGELADIELGDVMTIDDCAKQSLAARAHIAGLTGHEFLARVNAAAFTISEIRRKPMQTVEQTPKEAPPSLNESLDAVEVTVTFDLGERQVPLRELKLLQPGYVFDLERPLEQSAVRVSVNGQLLGKGQLLAIGDRLGVRITEFAARE